MARMLSPIASVIRGAVGGLVFSADQFHSITLRTRVGPARNQTNYGNILKTSMQAAITGWRNLTAEQKAGWNNYADTVTFQGPLGSYKLTGRLMYIRTYVEIFYWNTAWGTTFPTAGFTLHADGLLNVGPIEDDVITSVGTGVAISVTNDTGYDATALLRVSGPWGATKMKPPGKFDTALNSVVACPDGATTLCEILDLEDDRIYFVNVRMIEDDAPSRLDQDYTFRLLSTTVSV